MPARSSKQQPRPARAGGNRQRRSLTHVGGQVELWGDDPIETSSLARALDVRADEGAGEHVHGFHSYPGRMHPVTARRLVEGLSPEGGLVVDPFCGSGTVLVEARLAGRAAAGIDANPLAIELAWVKTLGADSAQIASLTACADRVREFADARRLRRAGATRRYGSEDMALFDPHVLLELDGLRKGLESEPPGFARRAAFLVLSAILVKVSRRPGDTARGAAPRRLASGFASRLFAEKARELAQRLTEFRARLPPTPRPVRLEVGDARKPRSIDAGSVDLVLTSPPYAGTYDYLQHHSLRLRWLGLPVDSFAANELGARRHLGSLPARAAETRWREELGAALSAMSRMLSPQGKIAVIVADSVLGKTALYADEQMRQLAPASSLELTAMGSQLRPHFHGATLRAFDRKPRREHVMILRRRR